MNPAPTTPMPASRRSGHSGRWAVPSSSPRLMGLTCPDLRVPVEPSSHNRHYTALCLVLLRTARSLQQFRNLPAFEDPRPSDSLDLAGLTALRPGVVVPAPLSR